MRPFAMGDSIHTLPQPQPPPLDLQGALLSSSSSSSSNSNSQLTASKDRRRRAVEILPNSTSTTTASTTTATSPSPSPSVCPVCFDCTFQGCSNYGTCTGGGCVCPLGFGGADCSVPVCNSPNMPNTKRVLKPPSSSCSCDSGFTGPNCNICTNDNACANPSSSAGSMAAVTSMCNTAPAVWKSSTTYCGVDSPLLSTIYPKQSNIYLNRNLTDGTTLASIWYDNVQQFVCRASSCKQQNLDSKYEWTCDTVESCTCLPNSAFCGGPGVVFNMAPSVASANGNFKYTCTTNGTNCVAFFSFLAILLPNGLSLPSCQSGECALSTEQPGITTVHTSKGITSGELAGISTGAIILLAGVMGFFWSLVYQIKMKNKPPPPPRKGVHLAFSHVSYCIPNGKKILHDVTGVAGAGQVMAIMGPSGAGKSTFLDIIAGKSKSGTILGSILINGKPTPFANIKKLVGYVDQEDLLVPTLTVRETLLFSAKLRLPESVSLNEKQAKVEKVMEALGLSHVADSRIGGDGKRGISGGEKRRVSIGIELVTNPAVLLLDEPTSGLDSYNALSVIRTLSDLAHNEGKTIIFTIHQPRSDIYTLFDTLLVLTKGTPLYSGPRSQVAQHVKTLGQPCPADYNMADHLLDLAAGPDPMSISCESQVHHQTNGVVQRPGDSQHGIVLTNGASEMTIYGHRDLTSSSTPTPTGTGEFQVVNENEIRHRGMGGGRGGPHPVHALTPLVSPGSGTQTTEKSKEGGVDDEEESEKTPVDSGNRELDVMMDASRYGDESLHVPDKVGYMTQVTVLMGRSFKVLVRTPSLLLAHWVLSACLGALVGGLYYKSDNTLGGVQNRLGSLMFILSLLGFSSLSAIASFSSERLLFMRERNQQYYSPMAYYLTKIIFDIIPLRIIPAMFMGTIAFYMIGFTSDGDHFIKYMTLLALFSVEMGLLCISFAIIVKDIGTATLMGSIVVLFKMLFSGLLINQSAIPKPLQWIQYLSFFRYAFEALIVNDLTNMQVVDNVAGSTINIPASLVLVKFGFDIDSFWRDFIISGGLVVGLLMVNGLLIQLILKERR